jgi:hypothetical protein
VNLTARTEADACAASTSARTATAAGTATRMAQMIGQAAVSVKRSGLS